MTADDMHAFFGRIVHEYGISRAQDVGRYARAKFREVTSAPKQLDLAISI